MKAIIRHIKRFVTQSSRRKRLQELLRVRKERREKLAEKKEKREAVERIRSATSNWLIAIYQMNDQSLVRVLGAEEIANSLNGIKNSEMIHFFFDHILEACNTADEFDRVEKMIGVKFDATIMGRHAERWLTSVSDYSRVTSRFRALGEPVWGRPFIESVGYEAVRATEDGLELDSILRHFCFLYRRSFDYGDTYCPVGRAAQEKRDELAVPKKVESLKRRRDLNLIVCMIADSMDYDATPAKKASYGPLVELLAQMVNVCDPESIFRVSEVINNVKRSSAALTHQPLYHAVLPMIDGISSIGQLDHLISRYGSEGQIGYKLRQRRMELLRSVASRPTSTPVS